MKQNDDNVETEKSGACLRCGSTGLDAAPREVEFDYGGREKPFRVRATIPFVTCRQCGFSFVDGDEEDLQHDAACRHLGVMTRAEIRALREKMGLTQKELAELTGLGVASVSRWERGLLIQNEACDRLLFLLQFAENIERLRQQKPQSPPEPSRVHNRITEYRCKYANQQDQSAAGRFALFSPN